MLQAYRGVYLNVDQSDKLTRQIRHTLLSASEECAHTRCSVWTEATQD